MKVPCRFDCKRRKLYCHITCKEYLEYSKLQNKYNEEKRKETEFLNYSLNSKQRMGVGRRI